MAVKLTTVYLFRKFGAYTYCDIHFLLISWASFFFFLLLDRKQLLMVYSSCGFVVLHNQHSLNVTVHL